jgi:hypothetical protein
MNKVTAYDGATRFDRVSKARAARAWIDGKPVVLCPVKLYPFGGFRPSMMAQRNREEEQMRASYGLSVDTFADTVQNFQWYNCTCNETGTYAAFYLASE